MLKENNIVAFENKNVRKVEYKGEWYFVINDVIEILTDSKDVRQYIKKMLKRDDLLSVN